MTTMVVPRVARMRLRIARPILKQVVALRRIRGGAFNPDTATKTCVTQLVALLQTGTIRTDLLARMPTTAKRPRRRRQIIKITVAR